MTSVHQRTVAAEVKTWSLALECLDQNAHWLRDFRHVTVPQFPYPCDGDTEAPTDKVKSKQNNLATGVGQLLTGS